MAMPLHDGVTPDTPSAKSPGRRERTERLRSRALAQVFNYTSSKSSAEMHEGISITGLGPLARQCTAARRDPGSGRDTLFGGDSLQSRPERCAL